MAKDYSRAARVTMLIAALTVLGACDDRPPTSPSPPPTSLSPPPTPTPSSPSPTPTPLPSPSAHLPVSAENVVYLTAPERPANSATESIVGRYTLEIRLSSASGFSCERVPQQARRRTYTADIDSFRDYYAVRLYDAWFLRDAGRIGYGCRDRRLEMGGVCHQFIMRQGGDETVTVEMIAEDEWRGSEVWEVLIEEGRLLALVGAATGTARHGRIEAAGRGSIWYGDGLPAHDYSGCEGEMVLTFTRR